MNANSASTIIRPRGRWWRRYSFALRLAGCFTAVFLANVLGNLFNWSNNGVGNSQIWVANGVLLAYLLLAPRWNWPAIIAVSFVAMLTGSALSAGHLQHLDLVGNGLDICEVLIGALLLRHRSTELPRFTQFSYLLRFLGYAVLAAPLAAGSIFSLYAFFWLRAPFGYTLLSWLTSDGMGIAVTTPAMVALFRMRFRNTVDWQHIWIYPMLLAGVTIAACAHVAFPAIFMIYPLLVLMLLRLGLGWSTLSLLFVAATFDLLTLRGLGPFSVLAVLGSSNPIVLLECFVATGMVVLYSVSTVLEQQKTTERRLQDIVALQNLVSEKSRDAIILDDWSDHRKQGSAFAKNIEGWRPEALSTEIGLEQVYLEDRPKVTEALNELHSGSDNATVECRIRKQSGEYIWVEVNLCAVRDPRTGIRSGILNFVRDIAERKNTEKLLQEAYRAVETLAITDALTGLANRRQFDHYLANEWRRGMRDGKTISLLMIDVDLFKSYNDTYGHPRGDSCLRQVAEVIQAVVARPGDLAARFGGEEFAVVLPNTGGEGAIEVANKICEALRSRRLEHITNPLGILTISVGCASIVPSLGQHAIHLIEFADEALYAAKRNGRNQICSGNNLTSTGAASPTVALSNFSIAKTA